MRSIVIYALPALALFGCETADVDALTARVEALEAKVADLEENSPVKAQERERKAYETYQQLQAAMAASDHDKARELIATMETEFAGIPAAMQAIAEIKKELDVIGKDAPTLQPSRWFTGSPVSLTDGKATLVVFWEVWCPHCQNEVPRIQEVYDRFNSKGLNVVGLTQVSRGKTDADVEAFLRENNVTYPNAKVDDKPSEAFVVGGIPAAAIVKGGKIVWRGHPGGLSDEALTGWLEG